jgi:hypothetical protein
MEMWIGCVAGALSENDYQAKLARVGFDSITLQPTRIYQAQDARELLEGMGLDVDTLAKEIDGKFLSAFVRAIKPAAP